MSIPTKAAVAALKAHNGDITLHFVLDGNLRDPKFSVQEGLTTRIAAGFRESAGRQRGRRGERRGRNGKRPGKCVEEFAGAVSGSNRVANTARKRMRPSALRLPRASSQTGNPSSRSLASVCAALT